MGGGHWGLDIRWGEELWGRGGGCGVMGAGWGLWGWGCRVGVVGMGWWLWGGGCGKMRCGVGVMGTEG